MMQVISGIGISNAREGFMVLDPGSGAQGIGKNLEKGGRHDKGKFLKLRGNVFNVLGRKHIFLQTGLKI